MNSRMFDLLVQKIVKSKRIVLCQGLQDIMDEGFIYKHDCYFFKKEFYKQKHIKGSYFIDKTGYEAFINSFHADDYTDKHVFEQALLFMEQILKLWKQEYPGIQLEVSIGENGKGFNVKCHVVRENEIWINHKELENFEEAILIVQS